MSLMDAVKTCINKIFVISGRARRAEYWKFFLAYLIGAAILGALSSIGSFFNVILVIYEIACCIPLFTCGIRRLHDTGRSGFYYFICLIPVIGGILLLVALAKDGDPEMNAYGVSPKYGETYEPQVDVNQVYAEYTAAQAAAPAAPAAPATVICPSCGAETKGNFCEYCGAKLN